MHARDTTGAGAGSAADRALIAAARRYAALDAAFVRLSLREDAAPRGPLQARMLRQLQDNSRRRAHLRASIAATRAGSTAGLQAKAAVLRLFIDQAADGSGPLRPDDGLAWSLACDVIAGAGIA